MGNGKRRENRAGILVSVSVEENEIVVDNLDAARSHTYLSATCVHGECTDDPYAWCNDGTARIRGGLSQKGLGNAQTLRGVGGLFFSESAKMVRQRREVHRQRKEDSPQQPHRWQLSLGGGCISTSSKSSSNSSTTSIITSSSSSSSSSSSGGGGNLSPKAQNVAHAHPGIEPAEAQRHRRTSRQVSQYVWRTVRERTYSFLYIKKYIFIYKNIFFYIYLIFYIHVYRKLNYIKKYIFIYKNIFFYIYLIFYIHVYRKLNYIKKYIFIYKNIFFYIYLIFYIHVYRKLNIVIASDLKAKGGSSGTRLYGEALTCRRRCAVINTGLFTACLDFQHGPHYALPRVVPVTSHVEPVVTTQFIPVKG
ncbi:hypothetical protein ALC60_12525 [Trachymyrmex zeteki]|uniref:Uncharacterized protein n=1 Tax=Mycetomoellerius zeteki TaxID=64791 RepID=A0A151WKR4_9HYME|nr:hypothetical protein ALC60_12525 [Trachymyrmex zeteki]